jgi:adenine-specific DNA methylase
VLLVPEPKLKKVDFEIAEKMKAKDIADGTVRRGSVTCPCCGYTTGVVSVRRQLKERGGGAGDARLYCVVTTKPGEQGRFYRLPKETDLAAVRRATGELDRRKRQAGGALSPVPDEVISLNEIRRISVPIYGMTTWGHLFTPRQGLALSTLARLVREAGRRAASDLLNGLASAVQTCLGLCLDRVADLATSLCGWTLDTQCTKGLFRRQAIAMAWDFSESVPISESAGFWGVVIDRFGDIFMSMSVGVSVGHVEQSDATRHPLPDHSAQAWVTDPPYYDAVPYAHLSDFCYVWLRRCLADVHPDLFRATHVPKEAEIVVDRPHELSTSTKNVAFYEQQLTRAFAEGRRVIPPDSIGTIVFASKTTASWEAILQAVIEAGWRITGSWPLDTEMENRIAAQGQARLASSVHLVCRPRVGTRIGDWRDILAELPNRIHEWMPRLASEGVVGADAIFACLGPALEVYSRYERVEKASGEEVILKDFLEQVWAAVAKEALSMIFAGADATGFDPDARLTAMWFWTLSTGASSNGSPAEEEGKEEPDEEDTAKPAKVNGFALEYDAARKIAQGLGAHLDQLTQVVEVKGDKARLFPVSERAKYLFGKDEGKAPPKRSKKPQQATLFDESREGDGNGDSWGEMSVPQAGATVLDRLHQGMILFAAGRGEALKRFLVEEGLGRDTRFWRLAQALSALYPPGTEEKRWVDGVLARKKGLGF